jgi:hypothetical protein
MKKKHKKVNKKKDNYKDYAVEMWIGKKYYSKE